MAVRVVSDAAGEWDAVRCPLDPRLRPVVRRLEGWAEHGRGLRERRELPMAGVVVMLQLGAPLRVVDRPGEAPHDVLSFVAGLGTAPVATAVRGAASGVHLELTPLGAHRLLALPLSELTSRVVDVRDLGTPWLSELAVRTSSLASWDERLALVQSVLLQRLAASPAVAPQVARAWERLAAPGGAVVGDVAAEVGWSRRHLVARFTAQVGLPPRALSRVVRFERAVAGLRAGVPQARVAAECGFYDQAHLHREVRALAGVGPAAL